jgi:hypothetical protein
MASLLRFDPNRPKDGLLLSMCQVFSLLSGESRVWLLSMACSALKCEQTKGDA